VDEALRPAFFAAALHRLGGAHYHGQSRFAAGAGGPTDTVTTTTDLWLDRTGNYRLSEINDQDGGRDVVLYGRELDVGLRYGKMIRRAAEEPEPSRLLEEALGAPWAAWEVVAGAAAVTRVGSEPRAGSTATATTYAIALRPGPQAPARAVRATGLRAWRGTVSVANLSGKVVVDDATGAVMQVDLQAGFGLDQDKRHLVATAEVHGTIAEVATVALVQRPVAEDLALRQRIVPEQKELLGGLPSSARREPSARPRAQKGKGHEQ
jgi:hypothetical protein